MGHLSSSRSYRKGFNSCKFIAHTLYLLIHVFTMKSRPQRAQEQNRVPKWRRFPNWEVVIQVHPNASIHCRPPRHL
jgi:hypothetical protein